MGRESDPPRVERAIVPSAEAAHERWERASLLSATSRAAAILDELRAEVKRLGANFDHLHGDVTALREAARIPRPECYPDLERKRAARRARRTPPAPEPPSAPDTPSE